MPGATSSSIDAVLISTSQKLWCDPASSQTILSTEIIIPTSIQTSDKFPLFTEDGRSLTITITPAVPAKAISEKELSLMRIITQVYLRIPDFSCWRSECDSLTLFVPDIFFQNLHDWLCSHGEEAL
jgi:hypothetical protein